MNDDMFDIENKNTEYEIDGKIGEIIGITKGTLQTFKNNLQDLLTLSYCKDLEKQFYDLKEEITSYINAIEECCILPARELLHENPVSSYRFCMYELLSRFDIKICRQILALTYKIVDTEAPEQQLLGLWGFCGKLVNETRMMLTIADYRVAEIVPQP